MVEAGEPNSRPVLFNRNFLWWWTCHHFVPSNITHRYWAHERWLVWLKNCSFTSEFYLIVMNLIGNRHMWLVVTVLDNAAVDHTDKNRDPNTSEACNRGWYTNASRGPTESCLPLQWTWVKFIQNLLKECVKDSLWV